MRKVFLLAATNAADVAASTEELSKNLLRDCLGHASDEDGATTGRALPGRDPIGV